MGSEFFLLSLFFPVSRLQTNRAWAEGSIRNNQNLPWSVSRCHDQGHGTAVLWFVTQVHWYILCVGCWSVGLKVNFKS